MVFPEKDKYFKYNKYPEKTIRKYIEIYYVQSPYCFWFYLARYQDLSEDFIREFLDNFDDLKLKLFDGSPIMTNWNALLLYQDLSESFLIEFIDKINFFYLERNEKIPEKVKRKIINLKKVQNA